MILFDMMKYPTDLYELFLPVIIKSASFSAENKKIM
jgi:hypothetical protein